MTGAPEDYLSICAMCSDTDAAVRWTIRESTQFDILLLRYSCSQSNGTEQVNCWMSNKSAHAPFLCPQRGLIEDGCFETYPNWIESLTGTTGVGYKLSTGVQCQFSVGYRLDGHTIVKSESCTIKSEYSSIQRSCSCVNYHQALWCVQKPQMSVILTGSVKLMRRESVRSNVLQAMLAHSATVSNFLPCITDATYIISLQDINECAGNSTCDDNADCVDSDGS